MRAHELTEAVDNFTLFKQINQTLSDTMAPIRAAKLTQYGSIVRRLSKALEPIILSHVDIPEGFTFELRIVVERKPKGTASGRMQVRWDRLLQTHEFILFVFTTESLIQNVYLNSDPAWAASLVRSFSSTISHELVHLQQQSQMINSLIARGYDDNLHLDLHSRAGDKEYHDRPIEAQAFAVQHATEVFFRIAVKAKSVDEILDQLKQVRSSIPRAFRSPEDRYKDPTPYEDPYGVFEENPYLDRSARGARHVSEATRRYFIRNFINALNRIIDEQSQDRSDHPVAA